VEREARLQAGQELAGARERADAEAALRARADAELERLRAEQERTRERGAEELRAMVVAAVRDAAPS
jgi:colicin import membrane protein